MEKAKAWEELELKDDFMFAKVMRNQILCKELLQAIFPYMKIIHIEYPEEQKSINITSDGKSVRLDVYVQDDAEIVYNIEIQSVDTGELPKRSRYYQGMIDLNLIEKGEHYRNLKESFVIFICTFDLFGKGRYLYTFRNLCVEDDAIELNDGTAKVFLNAKGRRGSADPALKEFLSYLDSGQIKGDFAKRIEKEVKRVRENKEWRREYMTLLMRDRENLEKGRKEGEEKMLTLIECLIKDNRIDDIAKMKTDKTYRQKLYQEYSL
ncbi:MAG: Rpn family recombination-promoting nuclease/putative transposase [Lachnospiraceae bacterium]|nr:Rpn family recombination-promoting nuclease/putative transposase [Lachnospiraceae bacterium]